MKKTIAVVLAVVLAAMMLAACGPSQAELQALVDEAMAAAQTDPAAAEPVAEPTEEPSEEPSKEPEAAKAAAAGGAPGAFLAEGETTPEKPAKIGEWVESKRYNAASEKEETIYYRIMGVERGAAAEAAVKEYNDGGSIFVLSELEDPDLEYCLVSYEVYFPEDFTSNEWGISSTDISLRATNPDGGGFKYNGRSYIGLGSVYEVSQSAEDVFPGDTVQFQGVFAMIKDFKDYVFQCDYSVKDDAGNYTEVLSYVESA